MNETENNGLKELRSISKLINKTDPIENESNPDFALLVSVIYSSTSTNQKLYSLALQLYYFYIIMICIRNIHKFLCNLNKTYFELVELYMHTKIVHLKIQKSIIYRFNAFFYQTSQN